MPLHPGNFQSMKPVRKFFLVTLSVAGSALACKVGPPCSRTPVFLFVVSSGFRASEATEVMGLGM